MKKINNLKIMPNTLRNLLESGEDFTNMNVYRVRSSSKVWNYSGVVEIEILKVLREAELVKLKYITSLPEHFKQGDEVWLDFDRCDIFEVIL